MTEPVVHIRERKYRWKIRASMGGAESASSSPPRQTALRQQAVRERRQICEVKSSGISIGTACKHDRLPTLVVQPCLDHKGGPRPSAPPKSTTFGQNNEVGPGSGPGAVQAPVQAGYQSGVGVVQAVHPSSTTTHEEKSRGIGVHMDLDHLDHTSTSTTGEQSAQSRDPFFLLEALTPLWPVSVFTRVESILAR